MNRFRAPARTILPGLLLVSAARGREVGVLVLEGDPAAGVGLVTRIDNRSGAGGRIGIDVDTTAIPTTPPSAIQLEPIRVSGWARKQESEHGQSTLQRFLLML